MPGRPAAALAEKPVSQHPDTVAPPLTAGELVAPGYGVLAFLHRSTVLDVYDVWSEERACRCIAKVLRPDRLGDERERRKLIQEGQLLERLTHPHIVRAYETLEEPSAILILETLTGATVARLIDERRRFHLNDVVFLGLHLASAMHYLHRHGFLHLDLKPSNIICDSGLAKVIDLSIARPPGTGRKGAGTRQYMAPEQARGDAITPATDAWGIGAVLFEVITSHPPFRAFADRSKCDQLERRADRVRTQRRVPAALASAVDSCLEPQPHQRPTVDDLMKSLASLI
jgi:serine/threonine protein kinase